MRAYDILVARDTLVYRSTRRLVLVWRFLDVLAHLFLQQDSSCNTPFFPLFLCEDLLRTNSPARLALHLAAPVRRNQRFPLQPSFSLFSVLFHPPLGPTAIRWRHPHRCVVSTLFSSFPTQLRSGGAVHIASCTANFFPALVVTHYRLSIATAAASQFSLSSTTTFLSQP
jgi:hypothetical protein